MNNTITPRAPLPSLPPQGGGRQGGGSGTRFISAAWLAGQETRLGPHRMERVFAVVEALGWKRGAMLPDHVWAAAMDIVERQSPPPIRPWVVNGAPGRVGQVFQRLTRRRFNAGARANQAMARA